MKSKTIIASIVISMLAISACDDETGNLGTSLNPAADSLKVQTDTFIVNTQSIIADSVASKTTTGYLGHIKDPESGAYITGDFTAQFGVLEDDGFPEKERIRSYDSQGLPSADSCIIFLYFTDFYGDSLNVMRLTAYELSQPLEENTDYYSNYDPYALGLTRTDGIKRDKTYTLGDQNANDSLKSVSSYRAIRINLNDSYTDTQGNTYNNYGTYLMRKYWEDNSNMKNSYNFIHNLCPGFLFKHKSGLGSMAYISRVKMNVYFRYTYSEDNDSVVTGVQQFAGTEEVRQTTKITNDQTTINSLANDPSCTYIKSPAGIFTELTLPIEDIANGHTTDSISSARIVLTRVNNSHQNAYNLAIPKYLLCLEKDSLNSFFINNKLPDNKSAYLTSYDEDQNTYSYSNISSMITKMRNAKEQGERGNANWQQQHPNWNKLVVVPVTVKSTTTSTSTTVTKVTHNMSLTSTRLVGGEQNAHDPVKISIIYQKFND